ncbi:MAG: L28 family ribosomal protein [Candidatus Omnitrophota bacterium]
MAKFCFICKKHTVIGGHIARRGMARIKGGAGRKITGRSKRTFKPNVQRMRIIDNNGTVHTTYVCTKCLKAGKIRKA